MTAKTSSKTSSGRVDERDLGRDAGDADEHVRRGAAEPLVDGREGGGDLLRPREVAREVAEAVAAQLRGLVAVAQVEPGHGRALAAEHRGHALADAARTRP